MNQIIEGKDVEFEPTVYYRFIDGQLQLDVGYEPIIVNKEESGDEEIFITLNIDSKSFEHKPDKRETATMQKRMFSNKKQITIPEFMEAIEDGRSFKAAALNGNKNIDWESQQVFALDIDNDEKSVNKYGMLTPDKAYKRFNYLGMPPAFYYESFSSTKENPKFRLIFIVKNPVTDIRIRNAIQMALMTIMPEAETACKDLSRLFYGTNKKCTVIKKKQNFIDVYDLIQGMMVYIKQQYKSANATKKIKGYCEIVGLNMMNGYPNVKLLENSQNGKTSVTSIIYIIENVVNFPKTLLLILILVRRTHIN